MCGSLVGIIVSGVAKIVVGTLWYSDALFGKTWERLGRTKPDALTLRNGIAASVVSSFLLAGTLSCLMHRLAIASLGDAICLGITVWLGFIVPVALELTVWNKNNIQLYLVSMGNQLVGMLAIAVILSRFMQ